MSSTSVKNKISKETVLCFHCGDECTEKNGIVSGDKRFCCAGCKSVYEVLNENNLCDFYRLDDHPGKKQNHSFYKDKFSYLDDEQVKNKLILFRDEEQALVKFHLPLIHCSSCIWLLEHLPRLNKGILKSEVNFLKKEVTVRYDPNTTQLSEIAAALTSVGYEPWISLENLNEEKNKKKNGAQRSRIYKIGIAGFCFGNIMMLSFPEYFSFGRTSDAQLIKMFAHLNLFLSLPVFFYSASGFFVSAYTSLRQKFLNIDAPIALAILITFARSVYEILSGTGPGYLDSMSGIVFFMLVGRYFQDRTHDSISFERDYRSYFPMGITVINEDGTEKQIPVSKLKTGQRIKIHSEEIIPADSILFFGKAKIDYSFVTGESQPVEKGIGEIIYAGGKQIGGALELEVLKEVSQSYLTGLWNNQAFKKATYSSIHESKKSFIHKVSRYFSLVLFAIAITSFIVWQFIDPSRSWLALTSVLIVACPCTLLLSSTFTYGNMQSRLGRINFFLKNPVVIEQISDTDTIVFDKTGTLTHAHSTKISYEGEKLSGEELCRIKSLAGQSSHPLSKALRSFLSAENSITVRNFSEVKGKGIRGFVNDQEIMLGSPDFLKIIDFNEGNQQSEAGSTVYVSVDGQVKGKFTVTSAYRDQIDEIFKTLSTHYKLSVISGDNEREKQMLEKISAGKAELIFNASPEDKLNFIKSLQANGNKVLMIGDGLNDAGALKQSDAGIVITDEINNFTPASDVIMDGKYFDKLPSIISFCKKGKTIIYLSFFVSILYNVIGMYFATRAELKPVIAAILMPASSISIILFTWLLSLLFSKGLNKKVNVKSH